MNRKVFYFVAAFLAVLVFVVYQVGFAEDPYKWSIYIRNTFVTQSGSTATFNGTTTLAGTNTISGNTALNGLMTFDTTIIGNTNGEKVLSAGSYSSKVTLASGTTTEMMTLAGTGAEDDFYIGYGAYIATTGVDGRGFGLATLVEAKNTTGTSTLQGGQMMAFLGTVGGSEAATLKTASGDATAGMYSLWLKNGANDNCVLASGSKVANLWLDNSISGNVTNSGAEIYSAYITSGGITPTAVFGMESGTNGWSALFYFDETCYNKSPISASTTNNDSQDSDGTIKINLNGTTYYIPYFGAAKLN